VYVTNVDDCSWSDSDVVNPSLPGLGSLGVRCATHPEMLHPVSRYADALRDLRPEGSRGVLVAAIAGIPIDGSWNPCDPLDELRQMQRVDPSDPNALLPICDNDMGLAYPPVRLAEMVCEFGDDGMLASVCNSDWTTALVELARLIRRRL